MTDIKATPQMESTRRLSPWRVILAILILGTLTYSLADNAVEEWQASEAPEATSEPWFAPYVDVTATPIYPFEQLGATKTPDALLSFIVASPTDPCLPTWGTYYTLDQAGNTLDLERRIARLEQQGGRVAIAFGGALNAELSTSCEDEEALLRAYTSVLERYRVNLIDIDLERENLTNVEAGERRARVLSRLQEEARQQGKPIAIWLTLPVAPQGLTEDGTKAVTLMLEQGVDLAGVNVMTMDYGASRPEDLSMLQASEQAVTEAERQLGILYKQAGINLAQVTLWKKLGATPMIGQNDIENEVFTEEDAKAFNEFVRTKGIGRLSMWSANRDIVCGENYVNLKVVSDACSGVKAGKRAFAEALSHGFTGSLAEAIGQETVSEPEMPVTVDDPATSPYQIWQENGAYPKGTKVVWHGNVYEAKWWTKKDLPDNPVLQAWETPWQLVGPVLPGEKPLVQPTLPIGTYPKWSGQVIYDAGTRVLFEGTPFQAKWWNQGESPAKSAANPDSSPWLALTQEQILEILAGNNGNERK